MKIKLGEKIYDCLCDIYSDGKMVLKTNNIEEIQAAVNSINKFYLCGEDGIVFETRYAKHISAITIEKDYYINEEGNLADAISFQYTQLNLAEKIDSLENTMKGIVDTDLLSLNEYKEYMIEHSKSLLAEYLATNPIQAIIHNNTLGTYSITKEKQDLLTQNYLTYQLEKVLNPNAKITWNETGEVCEEWTEEEFVSLILLVKSTVYPLVSQQQTFEKLIMASNSKEEIDQIQIIYGATENE